MRLRFILGRVFSGLGHNMAMTISVVLVTFISLLFVGVGGLSQMQISAMQQEWYAKVEVSVYMCAQDDQVGNCNGQQATKQQIQDVRDELEHGTLAAYVDHYDFQNHDQVYADFQKQYGDTTLGQATKPEMLPQAFRIKMKDPSQYEIVSAQLEGQPGVEQVQDQSQLVKPLMNLFSQANPADCYHDSPVGHVAAKRNRDYADGRCLWVVYPTALYDRGRAMCALGGFAGLRSAIRGREIPGARVVAKDHSFHPIRRSARGSDFVRHHRGGGLGAFDYCFPCFLS